MGALTGVFKADFSPFSAAVKQAEIDLASFEDDANKVAKSLDKMGESFSGKNVIQTAELMAEAVERLGGTSTLTAKELARLGSTVGEAIEKMQALGLDVPDRFMKIAEAAGKASTSISDSQKMIAGMSAAGGLDTVAKQATAAEGASSVLLGTTTKLAAAFGIAFTVDKAVQFTTSLFTAADALGKMSAQTGISVADLQRLESVGDATSVSLDTMTKGITTLQDRIGSGDKSLIAAVYDLGLSYEKLKRESPTDAFYDITAALKGVEDQNDRVRLGVDTLGKSFNELSPAILEGFDSVRKASVGMSEDAQKALDTAGDNMVATVKGFKNAIATMLGESISAWDKAAANDFAALRNLWNAIPREGMSEVFRLTAEELAELNAPLGKTAEGMGAISLKAKELEEIEKDLNDKFKESNKLTTEATAAADRWALVMRELDDAGTTWKDTLDTIDGTTVEAAKDALDHGVALQTVATAFGLSKVQVDAVQQALKADKAEHEAWLARLTAASNAEAEAQTRLTASVRTSQSALDTYNATVERLHAANEFGIGITGQLTEAENTLMQSLYDAAVAQDTEYAAILKSNDAKKAAAQADLDAAAAAKAKAAVITGQGVPSLGNTISESGRLMGPGYGGALGTPQGYAGYARALGNAGITLPPSGGVTVNNNLSGMLLTTDPAARQALFDAINAATTEQLRSLGQRMGRT